MTNRSSTIKEGICRRSVLKSVPVIAGGIISTKVVARNLFVQAKLTHEVAKYQDHPNDGHAPAVSSSWRRLHANWWRIRLLRADGANSSCPSLPSSLSASKTSIGELKWIGIK